MEYAELHVRLYKKLKRWVIFLCHVLFVHLWGQKPICPNRADYGHAIQYDKGSFLKNKFLSFEEWVSRSIACGNKWIQWGTYTTQGTSYINHKMIDSLFVVGAVIN